MKIAIKKVMRVFGVAVGSATMLLPGAVAQAVGMNGSIHTTGPDSYNEISYDYENNCTITNDTDLSVDSSLNQNATSGDASVNGNTIASSEWNDWNPATWQSHGYSYDEWHTAFMSYLSSMEGQYSSAWNTVGKGGSAHSGDASNNNSMSIGIDIDNSGSGDACVKTTSTTPNGNTGGNGGSANTTGPNSNNGAVLGSITSPRNEAERTAGLAHNTGQSGLGGASSTRTATTSAGGSGGNGGGTASNNLSASNPSHTTSSQPGTPTHNDPSTNNGSQDSSISTTGPDSTNIISSNQQTNTTVRNTTAISIMQRTNQSATTGDAAVSGNTSSGTAGSGDAGNDNGSGVGVSTQN